MPSLSVPLGICRANCHVTQHERTMTHGSLWCVCVLLNIPIKTESNASHFGKLGVGIGQFIVFASDLDLFYVRKFMYQCWSGMRITVWTAKNFAKQNGGRFVEIFDSAPFNASHELCTFCNRDSDLWTETCVDQPLELSRPRPTPTGWLTKQVSADRA